MNPNNLLGGGRLTRAYGNCFTTVVGGFSREILAFDAATQELVPGVGINEQILMGSGLVPYSECVVMPFTEGVPLAMRVENSLFQVVPIYIYAHSPETIVMSLNGEIVLPECYEKDRNGTVFGFSEGEKVILKTDFVEPLNHLYEAFAGICMGQDPKEP